MNAFQSTPSKHTSWECPLCGGDRAQHSCIRLGADSTALTLRKQQDDGSQLLRLRALAVHQLQASQLFESQRLREMRQIEAPVQRIGAE